MNQKPLTTLQLHNFSTLPNWFPTITLGTLLNSISGQDSSILNSCCASRDSELVRAS